MPFSEDTGNSFPMALEFSDEFEHGFGWKEQDERIPRTSHAVRSGGRVWLIDPVDGPGLDERVRELGEPAGVVQLLDRHNRDCAAVAARLGVRLYVVEAPDGIEARPIVQWRFWREIALWFPEERVLVCADALGSLGYFRAKNEPFGVHPLLGSSRRSARSPGSSRSTSCSATGRVPRAGAPEKLREALATSRRRLPKALLPG